MIEVIKKGSLKKIECFGCGSLLRYDEEKDVQKSKEPKETNGSGVFEKEFIKCPVCGEELVLSAMTR